MALTIAWRELRNLFLSPLAWCVLAVTQLIHAWFFLGSVEEYLQAAPRLVGNPSAPGATQYIGGSVYGVASIVMLLVVPLLSMRLVSEERRTGSLSLLLSAPVSSLEIVLGKYLGLMGFLALAAAMLTLMPLSLFLGAPLDYGRIGADLLGLLLLMGAFAASGLFMSTLTRQPVVAATASFGLLLFLWIINLMGKGDDRFSGAFHYLSLTDHYNAFQQGVFDSADVAYYLLFIAVFLVFSLRRFDSFRLQY